jgi:hypothetical protein
VARQLVAPAATAIVIMVRLLILISNRVLQEAEQLPMLVVGIKGPQRSGVPLLTPKRPPITGIMYGF